MSKITVKEMENGFTVIFEGTVYGARLTEEEAEQAVSDITKWHPDAEEEWVQG